MGLVQDLIKQGVKLKPELAAKVKQDTISKPAPITAQPPKRSTVGATLDFVSALKKSVAAGKAKSAALMEGGQQLSTLTPGQKTADATRQAIIDRQFDIKKTPFAKSLTGGDKVYFPQYSQGDPRQPESVEALGQIVATALPMDSNWWLAQIFSGLSGGIEETTGYNVPRAVFGEPQVETKRYIEEEGKSFPAKFLTGFINKVPALGGVEGVSSDPEINESFGIAMGILASAGSPIMKDILSRSIGYATTKTETIAGKELQKGLNELTTGNKVGATKSELKAAQQTLDDINEGVTTLKESLKEGATIETKRDFIKWVRKIFSKSKTKSPEVTAFLDDSTGYAKSKAGKIEKLQQQALDIVNKQKQTFGETKLVGLAGQGKPTDLGVTTPAKLPAVQPTLPGVAPIETVVIPPELKPLAIEAKKFKTAEKFSKEVARVFQKSKNGAKMTPTEQVILDASTHEFFGAQSPVKDLGATPAEAFYNKVTQEPLAPAADTAPAVTDAAPESAVEAVAEVVAPETQELAEEPPKPTEEEFKELSGFDNFIDIAETKAKNVSHENLDVAELVVGDRTRPAIRQSGFYATEGIATAPVEDAYNQTLTPYHMALKQDKYVRGEKFGEIFNEVWLPTEKAINSEKTFITENIKIIKDLGDKYNIKGSKKNLKHLSDVMEGKAEGTPDQQAFVTELRGVLDDLRNKANVVRTAMGKDKIGYIKDYIPHIQKTTLWNELIGNKATISDSFDFIVPNQVKNPFSHKRMLEELPDAERNLYILLDRYVAAISKDIYITPAIENIKAYNSVLKNRELFQAAKYWDEYIRTGLIGKQHKLDSALSIGQTGRTAAQKWNNMVNLAFLTGKVAWNLATQPLSYIMNMPMEVGVRNSLTPLYKSFSKPLRKFVKENSNVLNIKSSDVRAIAVGEGRNIQNRIYRTKIDKWNDFISMISSVLERELTLASYVGGLEKGKQLGYKGEDLLKFADLVAARTQSMYNKENRALILNSDIARVVFPFQSFSIEMFNHAKEILTKSKGAQRLKYRQRFGKLFGLLVGIYLSALYSKALTGRTKTTPGTFVPFLGAYVDLMIKKAMGEDYYGGRNPITAFQIGENIIEGSKDFIKHGDTKKLRKLGVNFGLALGGIGGGGQINNIIDGLMLTINEDVKAVDGDVLFSTDSALDKVIAPIFGEWATLAGREYWNPSEEGSGLDKLEVVDLG